MDSEIVNNVKILLGDFDRREKIKISVLDLCQSYELHWRDQFLTNQISQQAYKWRVEDFYYKMKFENLLDPQLELIINQLAATIEHQIR